MNSEAFADRRRLLADLYADFNRRDIPSVLEVLSPDVVWPNGWEGGTVRGHDQVRDYWTRQWASINPRVMPTGFQPEDDDRIAVTVHQVVRDAAGETVSDGTVTHVYRFADKLVAGMEIRG